ncbi:MAG: precorrin-3B C(17)-methyltransferase [Methanosarcinales archaeon]|nr:precorrin-3B C(17)-methyltransferase [ANME-2 cluster archaeon]MDF1531529.1 precorrin-3B C(17)-methyltransferase [ANME-2 cluster archaeon]MDW7776359.1 precorrin-3B C(17)-methyltransferase [Methanosarcinales archaeon]
MSQSQLHGNGKLYVVGIGPGSQEHLTLRAVEVLERADVIIGNGTYLDQISHLITNQQVIRSRMGKEVDRARKAIELARDRKVAMVSGGDSNVYGMAGLVLEVAQHSDLKVDIEVVPGVTALSAVASLLGAPVVSDFAVISLSDLLTPWNVIEQRLAAAATSDMVIGIYNPKSRQRNTNYIRAIEIIRRHRADTVPVGIVKNALRPEGESVTVTTLGEALDHDDEVDMSTTVIIGNSESRIWGSKMITPRGYHKKYEY